MCWNELNMRNKIAPIMIVHGEMYARMSIIAINSFLKHHPKEKLYIAIGDVDEKIFNHYSKKNICIVDHHEYTKEAIEEVKNEGELPYNFFVIPHKSKKFPSNNLYHDRKYSSLKPLIMDKIIRHKCRKAKYILSLDADAFFTGNIINRIYKHLDAHNHKYSLYQIERLDPRMSLNGVHPGSGFTLWKRRSKFVQLCTEKFYEKCAGRAGGSQKLIRDVSKLMSFYTIKDPFLHFVSPDLKNPELTDEEILKFKPAYIHLHGLDSYERLLKFEKIFLREETRKWHKEYDRRTK